MRAKTVVIIGAGIGGLAAALRLAHAGYAVTVIEAQPTPGGKMRTFPSDAGPVDAGPTVLTLRAVFETLFADVGADLSDHVTLRQIKTLARHYWDDGACLDLMADRAQSEVNVARVFGKKSADQFRAFSARATRLFDGFDAPMMRSEKPRQLALAKAVLKQPGLLRDMAPHQSLTQLLQSQFDEPRLRQLFGRYATYVGGTPGNSPAILSLIWDAEARGVWKVDGGMHQLAKAIETLAVERGATFYYRSTVRRIVHNADRVIGVDTDRGFTSADAVLFNGDPNALRQGLLGEEARGVIPQHATAPRSLSADVCAFAARPKGVALAHHTVFFSNVPNAEFPALNAGRRPIDATLYLCAQDCDETTPETLQRFEIIRNAPPGLQDTEKDKAQCQTLIFARLAQFGLTFDPPPGQTSLTTPEGFNRLCPGSLGSLYGRSPSGMMAAFQRPTARTPMKGLYLCGGGAHPGAGVPMATLSGAHAAAAITQDLTLTSQFHQTATRGGTSTASAAAARKQSLL